MAELFHKLWITLSVEELEPMMKGVINSQQTEIFLADKEKVGVVSMWLRYDYVEGTTSSLVAYLKSIYVKESFRYQNIAQQLVCV